MVPIEPRTAPGQFRGGSQGVSVRIAEGAPYRVGSPAHLAQWPGHPGAAAAGSLGVPKASSAEAGWQLGQCRVDGKEPGGGYLLILNLVGEGYLDRPVSAGRGALLINSGQAFCGKSVRDLDKSWPEPSMDECDLAVDQPCGDEVG